MLPQQTEDDGRSRSENVAGHDWQSHRIGCATPRMAGSNRAIRRDELSAQGETAGSVSGANKTSANPQVKPRFAIFRLLHPVAPPLLLTLFLLTLMACRPCHGHDPELFDMDDEDGTFVYLFLFPLTETSFENQTANHAKSLTTV